MKKQFLRYFIATSFLVVAIAMIINFVVDPLQFYRRNFKHPLCGNDRWQVACFIKNFSFDTVVLGTSLTQNFSLEQISRKTGGNPIKLSIAGGMIPEQLLVLESAIKSGKLNTVLWGLDRRYFYALDELSIFNIPIFLYKNHLSSHLRYLINLDILAQSLRVMGTKHAGDAADLDKYNIWGDKEIFSKNVILRQYKDLLNQKKNSRKIVKNNSLNYLEKILDIIRSNPEIKFIIFFPPYSIAYQKAQFLMSEENFLEDTKFRELMLMKLIEFKNVLFFDFETDLSIIKNLDNYKDLIHYSEAVNYSMVNKISSSSNRILNKSDVKASQKVFSSLPDEYF